MKMTTNQAKPAGGRKYLLVPPDTFELLVKSFQEAQQANQEPAVQLALKLEKKVMHTRSSYFRGESDQSEAKHAIRVFLQKHVEDICHLYNTAEFCGGDNGTTRKENVKKPEFRAGGG